MLFKKEQIPDLEPQIICAPMYFETLKKKYPKRTITVSMYCDNIWSYWIRANKKQIIHIDMTENTLWVSVQDENGWPTGQVRKIR